MVLCCWGREDNVGDVESGCVLLCMLLYFLVERQGSWWLWLAAGQTARRSARFLETLSKMHLNYHNFSSSQ